MLNIRCGIFLKFQPN